MNIKKEDPKETIETTVVDSIEGTDLEDKTPPAEPKKRKAGRPRKSELASKKKGGRAAVGRPKGDAAIINEYKARMLNSPKSRRVLDSILDAALNDDHKNQSAAWKLLMDRMLPVSYFEKEKDGSGRAAVNITISGVGGEAIDIGSSQPTQDNDDIQDIDYEVVDK